MKKIIIQKIVMPILFIVIAFGFFYCSDSGDTQTPEKEIKPERMRITETHVSWGTRDWYILLDTKTNTNYLVCLTGSSDGGIAVIKLEQ